MKKKAYHHMCETANRKHHLPCVCFLIGTGKMLGFDIETTGLIKDIPIAEISVVCTIDSSTGEEIVYNFMQVFVA